MSRWRRLSWELEKESVISRMSLYPSTLYWGFESFPVYACPTLRGVRVDNREFEPANVCKPFGLFIYSCDAIRAEIERDKGNKCPCSFNEPVKVCLWTRVVPLPTKNVESKMRPSINRCIACVVQVGGLERTKQNIAGKEVKVDILYIATGTHRSCVSRRRLLWWAPRNLGFSFVCFFRLRLRFLVLSRRWRCIWLCLYIVLLMCLALC